VAFQKKPDEGRMKGLAFIKDPDGVYAKQASQRVFFIYKHTQTTTTTDPTHSNKPHKQIVYTPRQHPFTPTLNPPNQTGYWVEVISRDSATFGPAYPAPYTFAQTMLRVRDPHKSLHFYRDLLGAFWFLGVFCGMVWCDWAASCVRA
jgi:hypothetical protein